MDREIVLLAFELGYKCREQGLNYLQAETKIKELLDRIEKDGKKKTE